MSPPGPPGPLAREAELSVPVPREPKEPVPRGAWLKEFDPKDPVARELDPRDPVARLLDPREPVARDVVPRERLEGVVLARLPKGEFPRDDVPREEGGWREEWVCSGEVCWRREEQEELALEKERGLAVPLLRGLNPPLSV